MPLGTEGRLYSARVYNVRLGWMGNARPKDRIFAEELRTRLKLIV